MEGDISRLRALLSHLLASHPSESKAEIAPFKQLKKNSREKRKETECTLESLTGPHVCHVTPPQRLQEERLRCFQN